MLRIELAERFLETEVSMSLSIARRLDAVEGPDPELRGGSAVKLYSMELNQRIANTGVPSIGHVRPARPRQQAATRR